jgi:ribosomal protein S18 acetylase RimI-like enzyme
MPLHGFTANMYLSFMLVATEVKTAEELQQIYELNQQNLKQNISAEEREQEGFVSWLYSIDLLQQMHQLAPSIIVKDGDKVVGYALATLQEARAFHHDLEEMFHGLEAVTYKGQPLFRYRFYCMGQICVAKDYRGQGLVNSLYLKHKEVYGPHYDFLLTEISTRNPRSQKAHEKVGFRTIHSRTDSMDEWNVVVWEWRREQ